MKKKTSSPSGPGKKSKTPQKKAVKAPSLAPKPMVLVKPLKRKDQAYIGRAAIIDIVEIGCQVIVVAPDDAGVMRACTRLNFKYPISGKYNKTVRITPE